MASTCHITVEQQIPITVGNFWVLFMNVLLKKYCEKTKNYKSSFDCFNVFSYFWLNIPLLTGAPDYLILIFISGPFGFDLNNLFSVYH